MGVLTAEPVRRGSGKRQPRTVLCDQGKPSSKERLSSVVGSGRSSRPVHWWANVLCANMFGPRGPVASDCSGPAEDEAVYCIRKCFRKLLRLLLADPNATGGPRDKLVKEINTSIRLCYGPLELAIDAPLLQ